MTPEEMAAIHSAAFDRQRPWSAEEISELLNSAFVFSVEATQDCFALGRTIADEAELLTIATHPDAQRMGLAKACLTEFLTICREKQAQSVFLEVDAENLAAQSLYRRFGFSETGRRRNYYRLPSGDQSDAILMSLEIAN